MRILFNELLINIWGQMVSENTGTWQIERSIVLIYVPRKTGCYSISSILFLDFYIWNKSLGLQNDIKRVNCIITVSD